jgi:hypothetical protein
MKRLTIITIIGAIGVPLVTVPAHADPDMVAHLSFEDGVDPTGDFSAHGNVGDLRPDGTGPAFVMPGAPVPSGGGWSLAFDGIDDEVAIANAPDLNFFDGQQMTMAVWVFADPFDQQNDAFNIVGKRVGCEEMQYQFAQAPGVGLHFNGGGGIVPTGGDLVIGGWTHVAATYDGAGTLSTYVNGAPGGMLLPYSLGAANGADLMLGVAGTCSHFRGRLDEFRLYRRALSPPEIGGLANGGGPCCDPPPDDGTIHDPNEFDDATSGLGSPTVVNFDELDASPMNASLEGRDPFDGSTYADEGITFSNESSNLYIAPAGLEACGGPGGPGCQPWNESNSLSVGQFPNPDPVTDFNDDDLVVEIDPPMPALGFTIVESNGSGPGESIRFFDADGDVVHETGLGGPAYDEWRGFFGIVSEDRPIARIEIDEGFDDGDDITYDDFILVPPPVPDFTPTIVEIRNESLVTDYGTTPLFTGWARTIDVDIANVGGITGDVRLDVWVRTVTDGKRTLVGSALRQVGSGQTVHEHIDWNAFGMAGDVVIEARTCSPEDENTVNDTASASHHVLVGGTAFGLTGPVTFASGAPACGR